MIKRLFEKLCCSRCGHDFDENSIKILRKEEGLNVLQINCQNCQKSFGMAIMGLSEQEFEGCVVKKADFPLEIQQGAPPINYDDVLDAHIFFQNLGDDWAKNIH